MRLEISLRRLVRTSSIRTRRSGSHSLDSEVLSQNSSLSCLPRDSQPSGPSFSSSMSSIDVAPLSQSHSSNASNIYSLSLTFCSWSPLTGINFGIRFEERMAVESMTTDICENSLTLNLASHPPHPTLSASTWHRCSSLVGCSQGDTMPLSA